MPKSDSSKNQARAEAQRLVQKLLKETREFAYEFKDIAKLRATKEVLSAAPEVQIEFIRRACALIADMRQQRPAPSRNTIREYFNLIHDDRFPRGPQLLSRQLFRKRLPFTPEDLLAMVDRLAHLGCFSTFNVPMVVKRGECR